MDTKTFCWIIFCLLFSAGVSAAASVEAGIVKTTLAKNYNTLKAKTDMGKKVRVIAKIKGIVIGQPRAKAIPQGFLSARNVLEQRGLKVQREFSRLGLLVFEVDSFSLDSLINSGLVEKIEEDIPVPPNLVQSISQINADLAHDAGNTYIFISIQKIVIAVDKYIEKLLSFTPNRKIWAT